MRTSGSTSDLIDLIDLQLLRRDLFDEDLSRVREASERLFASRKRHPWPPTVTARDGWEARYDAECEGAGEAEVIESLEAAVDWANRLVRQIATVAPPPPCSSGAAELRTYERRRRGSYR